MCFVPCSRRVVRNSFPLRIFQRSKWARGGTDTWEKGGGGVVVKLPSSLPSSLQRRVSHVYTTTPPSSSPHPSHAGTCITCTHSHAPPACILYGITRSKDVETPRHVRKQHRLLTLATRLVDAVGRWRAHVVAPSGHSQSQ